MSKDPTKTIQHRLAGNPFGFSATRIDRLDASEYTLVTLTVDVSGSVCGYLRDLEQAMAEVIRACRLSPRADNLLVRTVLFDNALHEFHGFKPLHELAPDDYLNKLRAGGSTALYDAAHNSIQATTTYAADLATHGLVANAIAIVLTDGEDNASTLTAKQVGDVAKASIHSETLESMLSILVGVGVQGPTSSALMAFSAQGNMDHYLNLSDANASTLAGLADFVSRNIQAQSQVLGTGKSSAILSF